MRRAGCVLFVLVIGVWLVAVHVAAGASPQASLRGAWRAVWMVQNGGRLPEANVRQLMFVFSDQTITMRFGSKKLAETAYTIDAKATPATIDMTFEGQATLGIYELAGDKLRISLNDLGKGRPAKILADAGKGCDIDLLLSRADREWDVLHIMNADGTNPRLLVSHPEFTTHGSPEWSLDGKKIGFDACRSIYGEPWSESHIFTCDADGRGLKDLGPGAMPSWSPDGKRITFSCYNPRGVWIMNADGTGRELLDDEGWGAEWCPKGEKIAYTLYRSGGANISVRDLAKETSRELLENRYRQIYWGMAWSPDGHWIGFKGVSADKKELAVVSAEGQAKGFRVLVFEGTAGVKDILECVSWSPDSKHVLAGLTTQTHPARQLYLIDIQGKDPPKLLPGQRIGRWYNSIAWSFDGKRILFTSPPEVEGTK